ncbi:MAG: hypothetical protein AABY07_11240 [Nanoarchaeota archaeon]
MKRIYRTISRKVGQERVKDYVIRFKNINLQSLKNGLERGRSFTLAYLIKNKKIKYEIIIQFWRLDVIPNLKKKYKKETYVLGVEKGDARWQIDHENLLIDERHEFHKVEEIINYLDKKGYLKREEWIKD